MSGSDVNVKVVWGIVTRGGETSWTRVGSAWDGPNGSMFARLDSLPISGDICIREWGPPCEVGQDPELALGGSGLCAYVPMAAEPIS